MRSFLRGTVCFLFAVLCPGQGYGQTLTRFPIPRHGSNPSDITAGPDGNLWFTERGAVRIGRITPGGAITEFLIGSGLWQLAPIAIAPGADEHLWFTMPDASMIGRISLEGTTTLFDLPPDAFPTALTLGPDGNIWFIDGSYANRIGRIAESGSVALFPLPAGARGTSLTTGPDGNLWVLLVGPAQVARVTIDGEATSFAVPSYDPTDVISGPGGYLWFTSASDDAVGRFSRQTGRVRMFPVGSYPRDITVGEDQNLWFTMRGGIGRLTPAGSFDFFDTGTFGIGPTGITSGPDGNLWFLESDLGNVVRFALPPPPTPRPTPASLREQIYLGHSTSVSVLDPVSRRIVATLDQVHHPIVAHPNGDTLYAACRGLCAVDTRTLEQGDIAAIGGPAAPFAVNIRALAMDAAGRELFVLTDAPQLVDEIIVVDPATLEVRDRFPAGPCVTGMAVTQGGDTVIVASHPGPCSSGDSEDEILFLDRHSGLVRQRVPASSPSPPQVTADGRYLVFEELTVFEGMLTNVLTVFDIESQQVTARRRAEGGFALRAHASEAWIPATGEIGLSRLALPSLQVLETFRQTEWTYLRSPGVVLEDAYVLAGMGDELLLFDTGALSFTRVPVSSAGSYASAIHAEVPPAPTLTVTPTPTPTIFNATPTATPTATATLPPETDCDHDGVEDVTQIALAPGADCDQNGRLDVCEVGLAVAFGTAQLVRVSLAPQWLNSGEFLLAADVNGDRLPDLIASSHNVPNVEAVHILINAGNRQFSSRSVVEVGLDLRDLRAGDLDGDGAAELVGTDLRGYRVAVWQNDGSGGFAAPVFHSVSAAPSLISIADQDADGDNDVLVLHSSFQHFLTLLRNGAGDLAVGWSLRNGPGDRQFWSQGDLDRDGDPDLAVSSSDQSGAVFRYINDGTGAFGSPIMLRTNGLPVGLALGDTTGDGATELFTIERLESVLMYTNDGHGQLGAARPIPAGENPFGPLITDVDHDGDQDLIVYNHTYERFSVLLNDGTGKFSARRIFSSPENFVPWLAADLDANGYPELISRGFGQRVAIHWNDTARFVRPGQRADCDRNFIPDECDLARSDCDADGSVDACQTDTDGDGVPDACDTCEAGDDRIDSDRDRTPDCRDGCPFDPDKVSPGACGCGLFDFDSDRDGVADCIDNCLEVPNPDQANADHDLPGDACDGCPTDRHKTAPGQCGCNQYDIDRDYDGVLDCFDLCPDDFRKQAPGVCGCGVRESDGNQDGIIECGYVACEGDCNDDGVVTVDELVGAINMALGAYGVVCTNIDRNHDGLVRIDELVTAITRALQGCPLPSTVTPSAPTPSPTPSLGRDM